MGIPADTNRPRFGYSHARTTPTCGPDVSKPMSKSLEELRRAMDPACEPDVTASLADWAASHPGQVVEGGVA